MMAVSAFFSLELREMECGWNHGTARSFQLSTSVLPLSGLEWPQQICSNQQKWETGRHVQSKPLTIKYTWCGWSCVSACVQVYKGSDVSAAAGMLIKYESVREEKSCCTAPWANDVTHLEKRCKHAHTRMVYLADGCMFTHEETKAEFSCQHCWGWNLLRVPGT